MGQEFTLCQIAQRLNDCISLIVDLPENNVGNQSFICCSQLPCRHNNIANCMMSADDGFYISGFDAKATNLHLAVDASKKLQRPVGAIDCDIACPINATLVREKRIRYKPFLREL
jgi:hypothetical protein